MEKLKLKMSKKLRKKSNYYQLLLFFVLSFFSFKWIYNVVFSTLWHWASYFLSSCSSFLVLFKKCFIDIIFSIFFHYIYISFTFKTDFFSWVFFLWRNLRLLVAWTEIFIAVQKLFKSQFVICSIKRIKNRIKNLKQNAK